MMLKIASVLSAMSVADKEFIKKDKEYLVVGKEDKRIGVVSPEGEITDISTIGEYEVESGDGASYNIGRFVLPTTGRGLIVAWGHTSASTGSSTTHSFPTPFENNCFTIIGSHRNAGSNVSEVSLEALSKSQFKITLNGSGGNARISWIAIGD